MIYYALTVFLSAFLLFQVQPMAGKMILPWFGGSASVWSACMVFFQTTLLGGYVYAHWLHEKLTPKKQAIVHSALLALSLLTLPIAADPSWKGAALSHPSLLVLGVLATSVGLPYFLISTTGPLLQAWYARTHEGGMPYRLYALSNFASMLALLSYPVLVEPNLTLGMQRYVWSAGFALFAVMCAFTGWRSAREASVAVEKVESTEAAVRPSIRDLALWIGLAACASVLLLAVTRHMTQDVAPVPFLWILPLSLYLLSFIFCFEAPRSYHRPTYLILLTVALLLVGYAIDEGFYMMTSLVVLSLALFVFCMFCHGELVRRKPHPRYLTLFYVSLSLGGALGGSFVGLLAPAIFSAYFEFPIGLALCAVLAAAVLWNTAPTASEKPRPRGLTLLAAIVGFGGAIAGIVIRIALPDTFDDNAVFPIGFAFCVALSMAVLWNRRPWLNKGVLAAALVVYCLWMGVVSRDYVEGYRKVVRNFYSQLRVDDIEDDTLGIKRKLYHGRITHGEQFMADELRRKPTAYYCNECGVGRLLLSLDPNRPHRVGVVGLGAGTLAAYGRKGDVFRMYEINPQVLDLARSEFTYLGDTAATIEPVLGDGRLMLEREPDQNFDVLIMDAFSGDSIPTHLVTLEAMRGYMRHLKPDGVLALHITNHHLDLRPVMSTAAEANGKVATIVEFHPREGDSICRNSDWVFIAAPSRIPTLPAGTVLTTPAKFRAWTDDYSNLLEILK